MIDATDGICGKSIKSRGCNAPDEIRHFQGDEYRLGEIGFAINSIRSEISRLLVFTYG